MLVLFSEKMLFFSIKVKYSLILLGKKKKTLKDPNQQLLSDLFCASLKMFSFLEDLLCHHVTNVLKSTRDILNP